MINPDKASVGIMFGAPTDSGRMNLPEKTVLLRGKKCLVKIESEGYGLCWNAYREGVFGWEKIRAISRTNCNRFPITLAKIGQGMLAEFKKEK